MPAGRALQPAKGALGPPRPRGGSPGDNASRRNGEGTAGSRVVKAQMSLEVKMTYNFNSRQLTSTRRPLSTLCPLIARQNAGHNPDVALNKGPPRGRRTRPPQGARAGLVVPFQGRRGAAVPALTPLTFHPPPRSGLPGAAPIVGPARCRPDQRAPARRQRVGVPADRYFESSRHAPRDRQRRGRQRRRRRPGQRGPPLISTSPMAFPRSGARHPGRAARPPYAAAIARRLG